MPKLPLIGTFSEAGNADSSMGRIVNMYAEKSKTSGAIAFYPTPGARVWKDTAIDGTCAGLYPYSSSLFAIMNSKLISLAFNTGNVTTWGSMAETWTDYTQIDFADNGTDAPGQQLIAVNGTAGGQEAIMFDSTNSKFFRLDAHNAAVSDNQGGGGAATTTLQDASVDFTSLNGVAVGCKIRNVDNSTESYVATVSNGSLTTEDAIWVDNDTENYAFGDEDFPKGNSIEFFDGYFIALNNKDASGNRGRFHWSSSYEGRDWNALEFATAERSPDELTAVKAIGRNLYFIGEKITEIWQNVGTATNPFQPKHAVNLGSSFGSSIQKVGNSLIFIGSAGIGSDTPSAPSKINNKVYMLTGAQHQIISTPDIDRILNDFKFHPTDVSSSVFEVNGHVFYRLYLGSVLTSDNKAAGRTFLYDLTNGSWIEEEAEFSTGVTYRGNTLLFHTMWFSYLPGASSSDSSQVIAASPDSDIIYEIDPTLYANLGLSTHEGIAQDIRRELVALPIRDEEEGSYLRHKRVVIEMATGKKAAGVRGIATSTSANNLVDVHAQFSADGIVDNTMTVYNLTDGTSAGIDTVTNDTTLALDSDIMAVNDEYVIDIGSAPDVTLEWTDDGGLTWKGPLTATMGDAGDDPIKIVFNNLGRSRDRTYRIRGKDLAKYEISDAYIFVDKQEHY